MAGIFALGFVVKAKGVPASDPLVTKGGRRWKNLKEAETAMREETGGVIFQCVVRVDTMRVVSTSDENVIPVGSIIEWSHPLCSKA